MTRVTLGNVPKHALSKFLNISYISRLFVKWLKPDQTAQDVSPITKCVVDIKLKP